jgi:hypothetical protein
MMTRTRMRTRKRLKRSKKLAHTYMIVRMEEKK